MEMQKKFLVNLNQKQYFSSSYTYSNSNAKSSIKLIHLKVSSIFYNNTIDSNPIKIKSFAENNQIRADCFYDSLNFNNFDHCDQVLIQQLSMNFQIIT